MEKKALCIRNFEEIQYILSDNNNTLDATFVDRSICENPENGYLQIIPYVTFYTYNIESGRIKFVQYKRANKITEERLSSNTSIGFGGHIDSEEDLCLIKEDSDENQDVDNIVVEDGVVTYKLNITQLLKTAINTGKREVTEELGNIFNKLNLSPNLRDFVFFTGNPEIEVNRVHLGISIPIYLSEEQFDTLFKEAAINLEEIESISPLSINFGMILEDFDITVTLNNIANQLSENEKLENWSCIVFHQITYQLLNSIKDVIKYEDMLPIINNYINREFQETE